MSSKVSFDKTEAATGKNVSIGSGAFSPKPGKDVMEIKQQPYKIAPGSIIGEQAPSIGSVRTHVTYKENGKIVRREAISKTNSKSQHGMEH